MFPWLFKWISNRKEFHDLAAANRKQNLAFFAHLKETLNPQMCRGFVDAFLVRKQNLEVWMCSFFFHLITKCLTLAYGCKKLIFHSLTFMAMIQFLSLGYEGCMVQGNFIHLEHT